MAARLRMRDAGGVLRTITRIRMRDAGNVLRTIQKIRMRDAGGVLRTVFQSISIVLSTYTIFGSSSGLASNGIVTTGGITATVTGGVGAITYLWEFVSGSGGITIVNGTTATVSFSATVSSLGPKTTMYKCTATDSTGAIVVSALLQVQMEWNDTR